MLLKSRFVEMFGDPVLNPYKLKKDSFRHICEELFAGGDKPSDIVLTKDETHPYPVYANGYENLGFMGFSSQCRVNKPAITISARGTIGFSCIRQAGFTPIVRLLTLIPKTGIDLDYLKFAIDFYSFTSSGTSQKQLTVPDIAKYEVLVPDYSSQQCFATFVHQLDKLKVILNQIDEKIELLKKSRFVELFGDPVQNDKCWPIDFCKNLTSKIGSGATPKGGQQSYCSEGISLIRSMNVFNNYFDYTDLAHINEDQAHALDNVIIEEKDVLLNITGASVARCCLAPNDLLPARVNQHVSIIRCKERLLPEFVCSLFTSDKYQKLLLNTARAGGATREALTKQQIENLQIIIPPLEEQRKYIEEVKQLDKLKVAIHKELELIG